MTIYHYLGPLWDYGNPSKKGQVILCQKGQKLTKPVIPYWSLQLQ